MGTGAIRLVVKPTFAFWRLGILGIVLAGCLSGQAAAPRGIEFKSWSSFHSWKRSFGPNGELILTSPVVRTTIAWDELIASWNASTPGGTGLRVEARALYPDRETQWYSLGLWSEEGRRFPRTSVRNQKDADGDVATDILRLTKSARRVQVRVALVPNGWEKPSLRFVAISLWGRGATQPQLPPDRRAWGVTLDVPNFLQGDYPGGRDSWCSPTSTAMVLAHWSRERKRPDWARSVPEVAAGVMDPAWPGTGNWSFNVAYAGAIPGIRAYVTRFSDLSEVEAHISRGVPVIVSLNYDVLRQKAPGRDAGHLMVVVGFTGAGDPILNDPGSRENQRRAYARLDFIKAWDYSRRTVYLIRPH